MSFPDLRPDPGVNDVITLANGVTYEYDQDQNKWRATSKEQEYTPFAKVILDNDPPPNDGTYDVGTLWYDDVTLDQYILLASDDGSQVWVQYNSDAATLPDSPIIMSDTPPAIAADMYDGMLWVYTVTMDLYVLMNLKWIKLNTTIAQ